MLGLVLLRMTFPSMESVRGQKGSRGPEFHFSLLFQPVPLEP